jgi:glycosyltransferase involved in cell wall biosynthesis
MKIKVAWLAPYSPELLEPELRLARRHASFHPCSWVVNLSGAVAARPDVELHVLTESTQIPQSQIVRRGNITFHVVKQGIPFVNRGFPSWFPLDVLTGFRLNAARLVREIETIRPDIVHAHGTEAAYGLAGLASGYPCLISMQGIISEIFKIDPILRFRIVRHWEKSQVRRAKYFACRTDFDTGFVRATNPGAKIFQLHEAMNPVFFRDAWAVRDEPRVLFVGSLQERKGVATLLRAIGKVKETIPTVELSAIGGGGGECVQQLKGLVTELGISSRVTFLGQQTAEEIARHHRESQIFALPSDNENSPNTLAEAMVSGMPVIATNVGGIPSMVTDGETGLLVEVRNPQQLAEKITYLLQHPEERKRLGQNAQRIGRARHAPEKVALETVAAYKEILKAAEGVA